MIAMLLAAAALGQDVTVERDHAELALGASWPAAADAIAPLRAALRDDMESRGRPALAAARRQQAQARRERFPFVRHALRIDWRIEGDTAQLVSLSALTSAAQGGGHSSDDYDALLWDRQRHRPVAFNAMLDMPALAPRFCAAHATLDRPEEETCPTLGGRRVVPADTDGNGRFDTLRVYVAVNYFEAEGYPVDIRVEPADIARLPDGYRPAFEARLPPFRE